MSHFDLWFFDCDGVLLDSNRIKTEAFQKVGQYYGGNAAADALVDYHVRRGGASRYLKFEHLFRHILGKTSFEKEYQEALRQYGELVVQGLRHCDEIPGVRLFLEKLRRFNQKNLFVVSGSDEKELRMVLRERELEHYFEGIFGAPAKKMEILSQLSKGLCKKQGRLKTVFFGDSQIDYEVATQQGMTFVMIYGYTEWPNWEQVLPSDVLKAPHFLELLPHFQT